MKLTGAAARRFCAEPDRSLCGALLYGPDAALIALSRARLVARLTEGDEMRLTRLDAAEARKDPALIDEALRARGFFPGRRAVLVEGARDTLTAPLRTVLPAVDADDAFLVLEAPGLAGRSSLRKLFEGDRRLASVGLYPEAPGTESLRRGLEEAGLRHGLAEDAAADLAAGAQDMDTGALHQLLGTIALYGADLDRPLTADEVRALLPAADAELDRLVAAVAEGRAGEIGRLVTRLFAAGTTPAGMLIATGRHFRLLLSAASAADGPEKALARARPPVFPPRRDVLIAQARRWGAPRLERALRAIFAADRALRSPGQRPDRAMIERALIRVAMMVG